ncbi:MAG: hypothetical protein HXY39_18910 [Chloroflexi bacterium]|nr:hypothetical protein [Chloroflexota bacterium]
MHHISIAIDPALRERHASEIAWTWRYLLTGMGYAWEECEPGEPCDIAYTADPGRAPHARLIVRATPRHWERRNALRLATTGVTGGLAYPVYDGERPDEQVLVVEEGRIICDRDIVFDTFWLLTGQEEGLLPKNKHGHLELTGTPYLRDHALRKALASAIGAGLEQVIAALGLPPGEPRWPHGRRAAAAVSHDVDYPEVVRWLEPLRVVMRQGPRGMPAAWDVLTGKRHHWQFDNWLALERRLGTRSVFYFAARQGSLREYAFGTPDPFYDIRTPRFRALFRTLIDAGCEIGLHGSYHAYANAEQFAREKRLLEDATGVAIAGHRQHYWHIDPGDPEATLALHERLGFQYDASLANDLYVGWRRGSCWPFFPFFQRERRELRTLQLSTGWMDSQLFTRRAANPGNPRDVLRALADRTAEQGGLLLVNIHDYVFDDVLFPGWARSFEEFWSYVVTRGDFWIDTPAAIAGHWSRRYDRLVEASTGHGSLNSVAIGACSR